MRIKDTYPLPEFVADSIDCADLICVSSEKEETVCLVLEGVKHDGDGKIDIRTFLFELDDRHIAIDDNIACATLLFNHWSKRLVLRVEPLHYRYQGHCRQGLHVNLLAIDRFAIVRICLKRCRKVFDAYDILIWAKEPPDERNKIKPFVQSSFEKSIIQIVAVNVGYDSFHVDPR